MKPHARDYAKALYRAYESAPSNRREEVIDNFVKLLATSSDLKKASDIILHINRMELASLKIAEAEVVSNRILNASDESELKKTLQKIFNQELILKQRIDTAILGGALIKKDDFVIDASISGKLNQLKR